MKKFQTSHFNLLKAKARFTDEPIWYRLALCLIQAAFYLLLIYLLKEWALSLLAKNIIQEALAKVIAIKNGRSP